MNRESQLTSGATRADFRSVPGVDYAAGLFLWVFSIDARLAKLAVLDEPITMAEFSDTGAGATDRFIGEPRMALYDLHVQASTSEAV